MADFSETCDGDETSGKDSKAGIKILKPMKLNEKAKGLQGEPITVNDEISEKKAGVKNKEKLKHIGETPRRTRNTRSTSSSELKPDSISKKFTHAINDSSTDLMRQILRMQLEKT